jgi:hypothetical protein
VLARVSPVCGLLECQSYRVEEANRSVMASSSNPDFRIARSTGNSIYAIVPIV